MNLYLKDLLKTEDLSPPEPRREESELYYRVVAGSFKNRNNAEVRVDELKKQDLIRSSRRLESRKEETNGFSVRVSVWDAR